MFRQRWRGVWPCLLLSIQAGLLAWSAACQSPTFDEPAHLAAGLGHWECRRFDLNIGNPPLVGMLGALPVMAADSPTDWSRALDSGNIRDEFMRANGPRTFWLITLARWALIPLTLAGGYVSYRWASELFGYGGGLVTLTLWCFSPNFLAHGPLFTGDMSATSLGIIAFYGFWKWLSRPTADQAAIAGVLLGLAELGKFIWVFLFLLWPAVWIAWRWMNRDDARCRPFAGEVGQGLLMLAMAVFVINLGFAFEKPWTPPGLSEAASRPVGTMAGAGSTGERFPQLGAGGLLLSCCLPFPESYVRGIGAISRQRAAKPRSYLRGQTRFGGWWYYYPYALAVKMPLGTLALLGLATMMIAGRGRDPAVWRTELLLLIVPFLVVLCFVTFSGTAQRLRYVLPALPFAFIWAGSVGRAFSERSRPLAILVTCCLTSAAASSLWIYPHSLSYFNALAGGPKRGHEHLSDANIDWGQGLVYLRAWYDRHPQARPFHLAYFGTVDPRWAGIEFSLPPSAVQNFASKTETSLQGLGPQPGWHAVSVNLFCCGPGNIRDGQGGFQKAGADDFSYFRRFVPVATAGYCIYIYHVDCAEANRVRKQLGLRLLECEGPAR